MTVVSKLTFIENVSQTLLGASAVFSSSSILTWSLHVSFGWIKDDKYFFKQWWNLWDIKYHISDCDTDEESDYLSDNCYYSDNISENGTNEDERVESSCNRDAHPISKDGCLWYQNTQPSGRTPPHNIISGLPHKII
jgi:hypothetical protein